MLADLLLPVVRHHLAVLFVIVVGGELEMIEMHGHAVLFRRSLEDAQALRHHFLADSVARNNGDPVWFFSVAHCRTLGCSPCNGPNRVFPQRCSAMLTRTRAAAYLFA